MIKVTMISNNGRNTVMASDDATIRQTLEENNVNYAVGVTSIDGCPLKPGEMDATFADMGIDEKCYLSVVVKADNAAGVDIIGNVVVVTSALKREDLEQISKFKPKELDFWEGEGEERDLTCAIRLSDGTGKIGRNGIIYGAHTNNDGYATATMVIEDEEAPTDVIIDELGGMLMRLQKLENRLPEVLEAIEQNKELVKAMVTVH